MTAHDGSAETVAPGGKISGDDGEETKRDVAANANFD